MLERVRRALIEADPTCEAPIVECRDPRFLAKAFELEPQVIFTCPFKSISTAPRFYLLKFLLGCHVVCYRREGMLIPGHEWGVKAAAGFDKYGPDLVDCELFWGEDMASTVGEELLRQGKVASRERLRVFGYPEYEPYSPSEDENGTTCPSNELPAELRSLLEALPKERTVLFVTGFHTADYSDEDIRRSGDQYDPSDEDAESVFEEARDCVRRTHRLRELWIEAICTLAQRSADLRILVKTHPIENTISERRGEDAYGALCVHSNVLLIAEDVPIRALLERCSLLVHYGSTTAAEACLLGVPSIFVRSDEVLSGRPRHFSYFNSVFPSNVTLEVAEVPDFVGSHLRSPIPFERTAEMHEALELHFNFAFDRPYTPSADMASFLLGLPETPARPIPADDPFLEEALRACPHTLQGVEWAVSKALDLVDRNLCSAALSRYLDRAAAVSGLVATPVPDLHLLRALCLTSLDRPAEAKRALDLELAANPRNRTAIELRGRLERACD